MSFALIPAQTSLLGHSCGARTLLSRDGKAGRRLCFTAWADGNNNHAAWGTQSRNSLERVPCLRQTQAEPVDSIVCSVISVAQGRFPASDWAFTMFVNRAKNPETHLNQSKILHGGSQDGPVLPKIYTKDRTRKQNEQNSLQTVFTAQTVENRESAELVGDENGRTWAGGQ
ncbi:hypothetical protein C8F04DRAFT_1309995 [Mycena alexandri]|uniref:Uncharacterized protein n=1 Tax=Mycena alexandri TaxID=1745969 RepID=A0AAD6S7W2_9AGAR|nr:hypothetical protein C8F04DRAFT_1309995 [Mycena alexandri]